MVLLATSPAYFRGFTLIALREGREGTADDDYTGQFQVSRCAGRRRRRGDLCILNALFALWESSQKMNSFACFNAHGSRLSCTLLSSDMEVKGGIADRCNTAPLDEARKLLWWKKRFSLPLWCSSLRARQTWHHPPLNSRHFIQREDGERHVGTERKEINRKS